MTNRAGRLLIEENQLIAETVGGAGARTASPDKPELSPSAALNAEVRRITRAKSDTRKLIRELFF